MTPRQAYASIKTENCSAVFGAFLFRDGPYLSDAQVAGVAGQVTVFYSRSRCVTYPSLAAARAERLARFQKRGVSNNNTPDADGLVFDASGNLTFRFFGPLVRKVTYLGHQDDKALATTPCTNVMLGLHLDPAAAKAAKAAALANALRARAARLSA